MEISPRIELTDAEIRERAASLDESKATFAKLEGFSKNTDPLIRQLQPAVRDLLARRTR